jgi:hypothetical protein
MSLTFMPFNRAYFRLTTLLLTSTLLLGGCSSTGALYREERAIPIDTVEVVVYRPDTFFHGGVAYQLRVNGKDVSILRNAGFSTVVATPGVVLLELRGANVLQSLFHNPSISLTASAGQRVFVRATPARGNTVELEVVSPAGAVRELRALKESL